MQEIKLYTKGIQSFIKPVGRDLVEHELASDGFNMRFGETAVDFKGAHVFTIVTTTECHEAEQDEAVYFSINDQKEILRSENPLVFGGDYFKHNQDFSDGQGVAVGSIKDWKNPICKISLDIEEEIKPWNLYFCIVNLRPFYRHPGIMGVIYREFDERQEEQLLSGEFYDPAAILQMFPKAKVANVEYDLEVENWNYELCAGVLNKTAAEFSFRRTTEIVHVDFDAYQKAISPEAVKGV